MRRWMIVSGWLVIGALVAAPAEADRGRLRDRNDTPGILDIQAIAHRHNDRGRLIHTVRTYRTWRLKQLPTDDENYVGFYFDDGTTDTDGDRFVWVRGSARRGLYARLYQPETHANGKFLGNVRVWRPNRRSVRISIRLGQLGDALSDGYRWRVTTSFESADSKGCPEDNTVSSFPTGNCIDNAPRLRATGLRHDL